jgi:hypothetical protein
LRCSRRSTAAERRAAATHGGGATARPPPECNDTSAVSLPLVRPLGCSVRGCSSNGSAPARRRHTRRRGYRAQAQARDGRPQPESRWRADGAAPGGVQRAHGAGGRPWRAHCRPPREYEVLLSYSFEPARPTAVRPGKDLENAHVLTDPWPRIHHTPPRRPAHTAHPHERIRPSRAAASPRVCAASTPRCARAHSTSAFRRPNHNQAHPCAARDYQPWRTTSRPGASCAQRPTARGSAASAPSLAWRRGSRSGSTSSPPLARSRRARATSRRRTPPSLSWS